jgi:hypothetical protein
MILPKLQVEFYVFRMIFLFRASIGNNFRLPILSLRKADKIASISQNNDLFSKAEANGYTKLRHKLRFRPCEPANQSIDIQGVWIASQARNDAVRMYNKALSLRDNASRYKPSNTVSLL